MRAFVIIPSIGARNLLNTFCLPALYFHTDEVQVIVVDNAAKPPISTIGPFQVIRSAKRLSFAEACNLGAKQAKGDLLVFLNDDCRVLPSWLEAIEAAFDDRAVIVGAKLYDTLGSLQHIGVAFGKKRVPYHPRIGEREDKRLTGTKKVSAVTGALMAVKRSFFESVGGFCQDFPEGNYEDVDLCLLAKEKGFDVKVALDAQAVHIGGASFTQMDELTIRRNWEILASRWKHKPDSFFGITKNSPLLGREKAWGL